MIEIHRLLKNDITDATGISAYTAYTDQAVEAFGLDGFADDLLQHTETYPDLPDLTVWVQDMHPVWESERTDARVRIAPDDALVEVEGDLPIPPSEAWSLLLEPRFRSMIYGVDLQVPSQRQHGRIAEGSVFTCYHGRNVVTTQTVLALEPFERTVTHDTTPIPGASILAQIDIEPRGNATGITLTCSRAHGPWLSRSINNLIGPSLIGRRLRKGLARLQETMGQEAARGLHIPDPHPKLHWTSEQQSRAPSPLKTTNRGHIAPPVAAASLCFAPVSVSVSTTVGLWPRGRL